MRTDSKESILHESQLYGLWQSLCLGQMSTRNRRLTGIYAGQLNTVCGPDYRGAEFELDGKLYRGDVEIHRYRRDWFRHGHHLDWRYDNVQLHLVAGNSGRGDSTVINSKGRSIPTLKFTDFPHQVADNSHSYKCRTDGISGLDPEIRLKRPKRCLPFRCVVF